jgi:fructose-1-phosphate kinase PfkB-like protein
MVQAAQHLGAPVSSDQTARELETAIRKMLMLLGPAIKELTELFEEARYSLHPITEKDGEKAHQCLLSIAEEMKLPVSV